MKKLMSIFFGCMTFCTVCAQNVMVDSVDVKTINLKELKAEIKKLEKQSLYKRDVLSTLDSLYQVLESTEGLEEDSKSKIEKRRMQLQRHPATGGYLKGTGVYSNINQNKSSNISGDDLSDTQRINRLEEIMRVHVFQAGKHVRKAYTWDLVSIGLWIEGVKCIVDGDNDIHDPVTIVGYCITSGAMACSIVGLVHHFKAGKELRIAGNRVTYKF